MYKNPERQRQYQRNRVRRRREKFFTGKSCAKCNATERLELDHIDPAAKTKKSDHSIWQWSQPRMEAELKKCQILCHDCHLKKTNGEKARPLRHGTLAGYKRGCKCEPCTASNREYVHNTRHRQKSLA